ncbi:hypothetical protein H4R27_000720 [Coemansia aciculifera]|nr:hypothetical protein H4R27_000720 [Coemansia aciculifera]
MTAINEYDVDLLVSDRKITYDKVTQHVRTTKEYPIDTFTMRAVRNSPGYDNIIALTEKEVLNDCHVLVAHKDLFTGHGGAPPEDFHETVVSVHTAVKPENIFTC